jgi:transposase
MCQLRSLLRQRDNLIRMTVQPRQPRHKSLAQMHLHLHHVMSDLTGGTGMRLIRAIGAGERDPRTLAQDRDDRIQSRADPMAKALAGDDRAEHGCTLPPSLALSDFTPQHIAACDQESDRVRAPLDAQVDPDAHPLPPPTPPHRPPQRHEPAFDLRTHLYRITGVARTPVPGVQAPTIHLILAAVGLNRPQWPTDKPCASWLGLWPDHQIRGGTGLATGRRRVQNRASRARRMAAQSLRTSPSSLGAFYRRMRSPLGPAKATTATAHTLAKMLSHMLKEKTAYRERRAAYELPREQERPLTQ